MMMMEEHKPEKKRAPASSTGFKGVVMQQNGRWGAQIYADHRRVWLGTFKSELEAAAAYDAAALRLRGAESHRNFPRVAVSSDERDFQAGLSTDALLAMIRDGSYRAKLTDFLLRGNPINPRIATEADASAVVGPAGAFRQLFRKELTPSDVGKLNRLVIPKKHATRHFPAAEAGAVLVFTDAEMRTWRFRYCYWRSSQSYVFTRGWSRFVKEKRLRENDAVAFYSCDSGGFVIGVIRSGASEPDSTLCAPSWGAQAHACELVEEAGTSKPIGIRLFGVQINA